MNQKNYIEVRSNPYTQTAFALFFGLDAYKNYITDEISIVAVIFYLIIAYKLIESYVNPIAKITRNKIKTLKWMWWFKPPVTYSYIPEQVVITNRSLILREQKLFSTFWTDIKPQELREFFWQEQVEEDKDSSVKN